MHIYLVGFMGAGKTTVGETLAAGLGVPFIDLDARVVQSAGRSIREVFEESGEDAFRRLETADLKRLLVEPPSVVALGGGTLERPENRRLIRGTGTTIWLHVNFEVLYQRLESSPLGERPLYESREQAKALYDRRLEAYRSSDLEISVSRGQSPSETVTRIQKELARMNL